MGITPLSFTGVSGLSEEFQKILTRSVSIASIPLQTMQNEQFDLLAKKQTLTDLRSVVSNLATEISALGAIGENRALQASSTNSNRVAVTLNGATTASSYTITEISSVASAAAETSLTGYATDDTTAVSTDGTMELVIGSATHTIDLTGDFDNSLTGLRDAINALDAGVSASILNTGTGSDPYYLSITALETGASTLELREAAGEAGTNILTSEDQGADAVFKLNGLTVTKPENTINDVVDGLSFTIKSKTSDGESVAISVSSSRTELGSALASLVSAYNAVRSQASQQMGEAAGLLSGDFIIREIQNNLRKVASYSGEGSVRNLTDLGLEFNEQGELSFNSTKFYSLPENSFNAALDLMGSSTTGFGALAKGLNAISDPVTGLIHTQQNQYDIADDRLSDQIGALAERIEYMQQTMSLKLQRADVLLAQLESQQTLIEASIEGLNLASYGKRDG